MDAAGDADLQVVQASLHEAIEVHMLIPFEEETDKETRKAKFQAE